MMSVRYSANTYSVGRLKPFDFDCFVIDYHLTYCSGRYNVHSRVYNVAIPTLLLKSTWSKYMQNGKKQHYSTPEKMKK